MHTHVHFHTFTHPHSFAHVFHGKCVYVCVCVYVCGEREREREREREKGCRHSGATIICGGMSWHPVENGRHRQQRAMKEQRTIADPTDSEAAITNADELPLIKCASIFPSVSLFHLHHTSTHRPEQNNNQLVPARAHTHPENSVSPLRGQV